MEGKVTRVWLWRDLRWARDSNVYIRRDRLDARKRRIMEGTNA